MLSQLLQLERCFAGTYRSQYSEQQSLMYIALASIKVPVLWLCVLTVTSAVLTQAQQAPLAGTSDTNSPLSAADLGISAQHADTRSAFQQCWGTSSTKCIHRLHWQGSCADANSTRSGAILVKLRRCSMCQKTTTTRHCRKVAPEAMLYLHYKFVHLP